MYDRDGLLEEIAAAIDSQASGELAVRWRTHNGQRRVELSRVADWDPSEAPNVEQLHIGSRSEENAEAVLMYRRSVAAGTPLSERVLAARFGRSKSWAHDRVLDARRASVLLSDGRAG
jgi:hypothetical protein